MSHGNGAGRVEVFARVRPFSRREEGSTSCIDPDDNSGTMRVRNDGDIVENVLRGQAAEEAVSKAEIREFSFDGVFAIESSQREVFGSVGLPVLRECLKGLNGTILAYGQTGSGKTFSLLNQGERAEDVGLLPRLVASLFVHVAQDVAHVYQIEAAAMQIYNEQIDDLLHKDHCSGGGHSLNVQGTGEVPGLTWLKCTKPDALLEAFARARTNVVYAETKMNKASSRSHAIFQIRIVKRQRSVGTSGSNAGPQKLQCTVAKLNIVDLAGSERVKKSGVEGVHLKEASAINKSLLAFGNVVSALAAKRPHIPFRDSKLTRVLDGSIGGNCKTSLLVCASPASDNVCETLNTLDFASRAMRVEVDAKVNVSTIEVNAKALLDDLKANAEDFGFSLGSEVESMRKASSEAIQRAQDEVQLRQQAVEQAEQAVHSLKQEVVSLRHSSESANNEVERLREKEGSLAKQLETQSKLCQDADAKAKEDKRNQQILETECSRLKTKLEVEVRAKDEELKAKLAAEKKEKEERAAKLKALQKIEEQQKTITRVESLLATSESSRGVESAHKDSLSNEVGSLRAKVVDVEYREKALKEELELSMQQLQIRSAAFEEASASLSRLREEAELKEKELHEQHDAELQAVKADHIAEMSEMRAEYEAKLHDAASALECSAAEARAEKERLLEEHTVQMQSASDANAAQVSRIESHYTQEVQRLHSDIIASRTKGELELQKQEAVRKAEIAELECKLESEFKRWEDEKSMLEASHRQTIDAQRENFEARLQAGRDEMESRLGVMQIEFEKERTDLHMRLQKQSDEHKAAQASCEEAKDHTIRQVTEAMEKQNRRIAAVFKAARCATAKREADIRQEYEELAKRFLSRESREEDVQLLSEQQRRIGDHQRTLSLRNKELVGLQMELQNRDKSDKIFGNVRRSRTPSPHGPLPPLPGKKVGDNQPFVERRRRTMSACRLGTGSRNIAVANVFLEIPVSAR